MSLQCRGHFVALFLPHFSFTSFTVHVVLMPSRTIKNTRKRRNRNANVIYYSFTDSCKSILLLFLYTYCWVGMYLLHVQSHKDQLSDFNVLLIFRGSFYGLAIVFLGLTEFLIEKLSGNSGCIKFICRTCNILPVT